MNDHTKRKGWCCGCRKQIVAQLHRHIRGNGALGYMWVCPLCGKRNPFQGVLFIKNSVVEAHTTEAQRSALPTIRLDATGTCAVCGTKSAEYHHWAPKGIFGESAEDWPGDYLCKACHDHWHQLVTPTLTHHA